ncbi:hypothetical protein THAOC_28817, partial [Thalassiosira oceanica]
MVTPPAYRLQSPRSDLSGYARRRATATRPRPDGQFRHEDQLISSYKSFGSYFGNYWTGEEVVETDLHPFAPSALLQDGLGLCCGDQVAVMSCDGHWQAAFVGIVGDPYRTWEQRLPQPRAGESYIDLTVFVEQGQGWLDRTRFGLSDKCPTSSCERYRFKNDTRDKFCCSYHVVRVFSSDWSTHLQEIDGSTIVINYETKQVLRRLSASPSHQEAFLQRMPVQRRYPEESGGRNYGHSGHRCGPYESRSQREPYRNRWSASRMPSDDSSQRSCRQESPRFAFSGGTFRGCPVGRNYTPASKSQKPMVELKPVVKSEPTVASKPVVKSTPAVVSKPAVKPALVVDPKSTNGPVSSLLKFVQSLADPTPVAVPKPAVRSPSAVKSKPVVKSESTVASKPAVKSPPVVKSKSVVTPKPAVKLPCDPPAPRLAGPPSELLSPVRSQSDVASESLVAPPPVVELPPRPAAAPDQQDATGFAEGWTSRTSRARREPSPTSDDLHSLAVAECVKKYV